MGPQGEGETRDVGEPIAPGAAERRAVLGSAFMMAGVCALRATSVPSYTVAIFSRTLLGEGVGVGVGVWAAHQQSAQNGGCVGGAGGGRAHCANRLSSDSRNQLCNCSMRMYKSGSDRFRWRVLRWKSRISSVMRSANRSHICDTSCESARVVSCRVRTCAVMVTLETLVSSAMRLASKLVAQLPRGAVVRACTHAMRQGKALVMCVAPCACVAHMHVWFICVAHVVCGPMCMQQGVA